MPRTQAAPAAPEPSVRVSARDRARAEVMRDLLAAARARLATEGAAELSLRAVARDLGLASSAVYRYVPSRDALLTLLVVESYDAVGAVCEGAASTSDAAGHAPARAWLEVARAVRRWALADPRGFELIYGTPVRGYAAPADTVVPATRVWAVVSGLLAAARADGSLRPAGPTFATDGLVTDDVYAFAAAHGADVAALSGTDDDAQDRRRDVVRSITLFSSLLGALTAELFGHLRGVGQDPDRVFDVTVATAAAGVGLHVDLADAWDAPAR
ncbi:TetR/AcrR family transcriptional regulator [Cellulomonas sp. SLBN-39]|uniref:TetR/AcrR family transcriptional regulator n=1 Tax=Cellulomonas sp. SLBN-39 TaxID=2768446 RepID=UPI001169FA1C|nr:TetR-like C-terminal domain-containing protein [Cellulomonas sp. SLBN-39]TQL03468.1 TetR family transcriptional regulator [Cellulomonas sp. SLBN-39]